MGTTFPDELKRLVEQFHQQSDRIRTDAYNETQVRIDFIDPMMKSLGWDMNNAQGFAEQYREVVHEDRIKVGGQTKAPDYSFRIGGTRKFFLEAKKPSVNVKTDVAPAYQLRRYAWSAKLAVSLLTDFEEFAVYDTRVRPKELDKASDSRREYLRYTEYEGRWDFISGTFSKDAVLRGEFDRYCETKKGRGAQAVDEAFLDEIEDWRKLLATNLALRNRSLDEGGLNFATQRILDRIIFLRIAEDRGTEAPGQLQALLKADDVYRGLVTLFNRADERYNSGLFHFAKEKDRDEAHDTLTPTLDVDDRVLKTVVKALYYPQSPYEFSMLSADILGSVYERFLGKVITLSANHTARIEEKPEVRKAGGVYYTPTYIVDYIVRQTVGKLLADRGMGYQPMAEAKPPKHGQVARATTLKPPTLKILDPACGSGSFLIGAYQFLLDWYLAQYTADPAGPQALAQGKAAVLRPATLNPNAAPSPGPIIPGWSLTIAERKRILLDHIHGVDLDGQAVEVTKLNLLLKCLEGETSATLGFESRLFRERALPDLGKNILCGNSLIGTDIMATDAWKGMSDEEKARNNPFDYERSFAKIMKQGGFDAVIGNPPYIRIQTLAEWAPFEVAHYQTAYAAAREGNYDIYVVFLERGLKLARRDGLLGFIVPNKFFNAKYGAPIRESLSSGKHLAELVHFGDQQVFKGATTYTCLTFLTPKSSDTFRFGRVTDLDAWSRSYKALEIEVSSHEVDANEWNLVAGPTSSVLAKLRGLKTSLKDAADIFVGLQTSADRVFVVPTDADLEECVATPFLLTGNLAAYRPVPVSARLIFPYELCGDRAVLRPAEWMRKHAPKAWKYLTIHRDKLAARDGGKFDTDAWYAFGRSQNLTEMHGPKLVIQVTAIDPIVMFDEAGVSLTGGGAGPFYCVRALDEGRWPLKALLGIMNSNIFGWLVRAQSTPLRGGYFKYSKQYIETVPLPSLVPTDGNAARLVKSVDAMLALHKRLAAEQLPQRKEQIQREIDATDRQIDQLVYALYGLTADEVAIVEAATA